MAFGYINIFVTRICEIGQLVSCFQVEIWENQREWSPNNYQMGLENVVSRVSIPAVHTVVWNVNKKLQDSRCDLSQLEGWRQFVNAKLGSVA